MFNQERECVLSAAKSELLPKCEKLVRVWLARPPEKYILEKHIIIIKIWSMAMQLVCRVEGNNVSQIGRAHV